MTKINDILNLVTKWTNSYFLKLNPNKTQIIVFGPKSIRDAVSVHGIFIDYIDTCICFSNVVQNLGALFNKEMTFSHQVKVVYFQHLQQSKTFSVYTVIVLSTVKQYCHYFVFCDKLITTAYCFKQLCLFLET